ncbi:MAG: DUF5131 family protein [Pseudonocardiaceae bacterium]
MSTATKIEWTRGDDGAAGATWNPVTGCTKVSAGCDHCYAETFAERWRSVPGHPFEQGFDVRLWPGRLGLPLRWRKPRRVFVNSMSDLFHDSVPTTFIAEVFAVMVLAHQHTFQVLTKRAGRAASLLASNEFRRSVFEDIGRLAKWENQLSEMTGKQVNFPTTWPLPNLWLGVSVESQRWAEIRLSKLITTPATVRFASCEPLLGSLDIRPWLGRGLDWVIVGGESGAKARPMHPEWACAVRDQCVEASVPFFFKQWGQYSPVGPVFGRDEKLHEGNNRPLNGSGCALNLDGSQPVCWTSRDLLAEGRPNAGSWWMSRTSKSRAGRELDGQTWDEFPSPVIIGNKHR